MISIIFGGMSYQLVLVTLQIPLTCTYTCIRTHVNVNVPYALRMLPCMDKAREKLRCTVHNCNRNPKKKSVRHTVVHKT